MEDMNKRRRSLATTKGKDTSHRVKPLDISAGVKPIELLAIIIMVLLITNL